MVIEKCTTVIIEKYTMPVSVFALLKLVFYALIFVQYQSFH